jgi:DNA-nicking Smr family endonuclease
MDGKRSADWQREISTVEKLKTQNRFISLDKQTKFTAPKTEQHQSSQTAVPQHNANTFKKFQAGKIFIESTLDLHGFSQDQAFDKLKEFVIKSFKQNHRVLLIITGKSGVLKQEIPRWLSLEPLASMILSLKEAKQKDGGSGALYILLRKNR